MGHGEDSLIIGFGECEIILDDPNCLIDLIEENGQSTYFPPSLDWSCDVPLNNRLLNQMIVTMLNVRYNDLFNSNTEVSFGDFELEDACAKIPGFILDSLPENPTVNDLINYSHNYLACHCSETCDVYPNVNWELTSIYLALNSRFDNCHVSGPCIDDPQEEPSGGILNNGFTVPSNSIGVESKLKDIFLYPNPTTNVVNLENIDWIGQDVTITIFNNLGMTVRQVSFTEIADATIQLEVHQLINGMYFLIVEMEGEKSNVQKFQVIH